MYMNIDCCLEKGQIQITGLDENSQPFSSHSDGNLSQEFLKIHLQENNVEGIGPI